MAKVEREESAARKFRVLNLGAGVQSTAVYLMMRQGLIAPADFAIFADTQDEPEAVYSHLAWLQSRREVTEREAEAGSRECEGRLPGMLIDSGQSL